MLWDPGKSLAILGSPWGSWGVLGDPGESLGSPYGAKILTRAAHATLVMGEATIRRREGGNHLSCGVYSWQPPYMKSHNSPHKDIITLTKA